MITGLSKAKASKYSSLKTRKGRKKEGLFLVQGEKAVLDSLPYFDLEALIVSETYASLQDFDPEKTYLAKEQDLKKISTLNDLPEVIAVFRTPIPVTEVSIQDIDNYILILDGVSDPGNFGTIIRTAHWFGIKQIFCSGECPDLYNPKVVQATMGSLGKIEIIYCDIRELLEDHPNIPVYGLLLSGKDIYTEGKFPPGFIVMGNEGHGISKHLMPFISKPLTIPPFSKTDHPESLNVAIATAVTLGIFRSKDVTHYGN